MLIQPGSQGDSHSPRLRSEPMYVWPAVESTVRWAPTFPTYTVIVGGSPGNDCTKSKSTTTISYTHL